MSEDKQKTTIFSNFDKQVFLINFPRQIDMGALLSRYSRTAKLDIREVYEKEFEKNESRGKEFYERVFLEYGDESVAELVNVHIAIQDISNLLVKEIEETRIGASYIEKSSRYVRYDIKHNGRYLYLPFVKTGIEGKFEKEYEELMNWMFSYYSKSLPSLIEMIRESNPFSSVSEDFSEQNKKAYETALRSRALDDIRAILPVSTLTNVGISSNARALAGIIQKLDSAGYKEAKDISNTIYSELGSEYGEIIKSARNDHGKAHTLFISKLKSIEGSDIHSHSYDRDVELLNYNAEGLKLISGFVSDKRLNKNNEENYIKEIARQRMNRRDKLPRQFEFIDYVFSLRMNYGAFREFQRHRMLSILRGLLTPDNGFQIPEYIGKNEELVHEFNAICNRSAELYKKIKEAGQKVEAQYVLPFASMYNIKVKGNLREFVYFTELRSTPQAHPDLRKLSISIADEIIAREKSFEILFKFLDRSSYPLGRFSQESKKEKKLDELSRK
ncbi:FAD-dependent thymidylate synthase [Cuniculiplasma sp. SKW3]|uniref:FAD-dependent thymidylate synthase n=1 Tax=Cuniculiplasma sp. SKW3 TaxID=3400170 RepID=UPI003FD21EA0